MQMDAVKVIIPWRHHPSRAEGLDWLIRYYQHRLGPNCVHLETDNTDAPFNRAQLINRAASRFPNHTLVISDADCFICDFSLQKAVREAPPDKLLIPHKYFCRINKEETKWVLSQPASKRVTGKWFRYRRTKAVRGGLWVAQSNFIISNPLNEEFKGWGYEDTEYVKRVPLAKRYSGPLYHLHHPPASRAPKAKNRDLFFRLRRTPAPDSPAVIASYFNHTADPQRYNFWEDSNDQAYEVLRKSVNNKGYRLIIFSNTLTPIQSPFLTVYRTPADESYTPNVYRWLVATDWLKDNRPSKLFLVDISDVEMLNDPFPHLTKGVLYSGYEPSQTMTNAWMKRTQARYLNIPDWTETIKANASKPLLNCGVFGGHYEDVLPFLKQLTANHRKYSRNISTSSDTAIYNYTALRHNFYQQITANETVVTPYKKYQTDSTAWFRHK